MHTPVQASRSRKAATTTKKRQLNRSGPASPISQANRSKSPHRGGRADKGGSGKAGTVAVFLRIRPPNEDRGDVDEETNLRTYEVLQTESDESGNPAKPQTIRTIPPTGSFYIKQTGRQLKEFSFTEVLPPSASQEYVYETAAEPLVNGLFKGSNGLIFSYGMTNSGKTFTISGNQAKPGILSRSLTSIFERLVAPACVAISFMEVHNDNVYDLLSSIGNDEGSPMPKESLKLQQNRFGSIEPRNLSRHIVSSVPDALSLIERGNKNRSVARTNLNQGSSRSHSVCTIEYLESGVQKQSGVSSDEEVEKGPVLWIVDLAGSERVKRTGVAPNGMRQKEANFINQSLTILWRCLTMMRDLTSSAQSRGTIPFRESKLTHLFMHHLVGPMAGKTVIVVNMNPSVGDFDETQHVLSNSAIAQDLKLLKENMPEDRQLALLGGAYAYDGNRLLRRKSQGGGRRNVQRPNREGVTPKKKKKLDAIKQADEGAEEEQEGAEDVEEEEEEAALSGAESDSALVDTRQSLILGMENLQLQNERLRQALAKAKKDAAVELEDVKMEYEAQIEELEIIRRQEIEELEAEFDEFVFENNFDSESGEVGLVAAVVPAVSDSQAQAMEAHLRAELAQANEELRQWRRGILQVDETGRIHTLERGIVRSGTVRQGSQVIALSRRTSLKTSPTNKLKKPIATSPKEEGFFRTLTRVLGKNASAK